MSWLRSPLILGLGLPLTVLACTGGSGADESTSFTTMDPGETGDGDGDPATGDGDGDGPTSCGDGMVQPGEQCDLGPDNSEAGQCTPECTIASCGDGYVYEGFEECDDGNSVNTDACVAGCKLAVCGDGFVQDGVEECDDGNDNPADGCTPECTPGSCGDGVIQAGEQCDDGNADTSDDCPACQFAFCGDGFIQAGIEICDDGNTDSNDACTSPFCTPAECGDGIVWEGMEECDDQNEIDTDACTAECLDAYCGDGIIQEGVEECDDQNDLDSDNCLNSCLDAVCGDGFVKQGIEECDDGNDIDDDECPNNCGIVEQGCDDIVTNMQMWGNAASGVDLRLYTNSTLHWIGCPGNGCTPDTWYCDYDPVAHTMQFGTTSNTAMRAVVDPNDDAGDAMPDSGGSCCSNNGVNQRCNAPDSENNGVNVDMVTALCASLGYTHGEIVREMLGNACPEPHAVADDGSEWSSDFVGSSGSGMEYRCSQE